MNRQIHQVAVLVTIMFLALAVSVTSVQGFARPALWEAESSEGNPSRINHCAAVCE